MTPPQLIELARVQAGLTQGALARTLGVSQPFVSQVEHGERDIPESLLPAWADACGLPDSYFKRTDSPLDDAAAVLMHRRMRTLPAKPFNLAEAQVKVTALELDALFREVDVVPALELPSLPPNTAPDEAAAAVRRIWRVPSGPIPDLTALIEGAGIPVVLLDSFHDKHSATSQRGQWFEWLIAVNAQHPASRRRASLGHDLAHIVLNHDRRLVADPLEAQILEAEADIFSSSLLMPEDDARRELRTLNLRRLVDLKQRWRVAISFLIKRAHACELISTDQSQHLYMELSSLPGGRRREPAEFEPEEPTLVRRMVTSLQADGLSLAEIADLMTVKEEVLRLKYLNERPHLRPLREQKPRVQVRLDPPAMGL